MFYYDSKLYKCSKRDLSFRIPAYSLIRIYFAIDILRWIIIARDYIIRSASTFSISEWISSNPTVPVNIYHVMQQCKRSWGFTPLRSEFLNQKFLMCNLSISLLWATFETVTWNQFEYLKSNFCHWMLKYAYYTKKMRKKFQ